MARRTLSQTDASDRERTSLEYVLKKERQVEDTTRYVSVDEAIHEESLYEIESDREVTRVLFISRDESLLSPTLQSLDGYTNVADLFDEVHILILRQGIPTKAPVMRVADNVWLYTATDPAWWLLPWRGKDLAEAQLSFAAGFRPDVIVARDPFESAVTALWLGRKYDRPVQIHIFEDFNHPDFLAASPSNRWRRLIPRFTIPRVKSIRVATKALLESMQALFKIEDAAIFPRLNNYESLITIPPTLDLREKYKPFVFIMLYIGSLKYDSAFHKALDAARFGLRNPHLGLIVLGSGPAQKEYEERAQILQIRPQVVFEPNVKDVVPYLKSANVLIVPDTNPESEEVVLQAAAAGIPMIMARTKAREDVFVDGESALMCDPNSIDEFSLKLNIIMNDVTLRRQMVEAAQNMITTRFHDDPVAYRLSYRKSIERVLFLEAPVSSETNSSPS